MRSTAPGRLTRRRVLVTGTVAGLAVASVAGSLVTGASASPADPVRPATVPAAPETVPVAAGLRARDVDGRERAVPLASGPLAQRLRGGAVAGSALPQASTPTAARAAAPLKPPAYTSIGTTGIVASGTRLLAFAPDGSRVAWIRANRVYSAHPSGAGLLTVASSAEARRLSWSPTGRFLALETPPGDHQRVVASGHNTIVQTAKASRAITAVSWLNDSTTVALVPKLNTFALAPVFEGPIKLYPRGSRQVLDAVASPDGTRIAVRARQLGVTPATEQLVVVDAKTLQDVAAVVTTTGELGRPAWSQDSATVYVPRTEGGATSVVSHAAATAEGDPVVVLADAAATPNIYLRPKAVAPGYSQRLSGKDAVATSISISRMAFTRTRGSSCSQSGAAVSAVLAKAGSVEATVAGPLAAHTCGPLLLTGTSSLDKRTAAELKRLLARGRTVRLVGNTRSLAPAVATAVSRLGLKPVRYAGADVYATAVQVALKGFKDHSVAAIASASQPMAAVVGAATAGGADVPLLLTAGNTMPKATDAFVTRYRTSAWVVGTQGAKAAPWAYRYAGANDTSTSLTVARRFYYPPRIVALVSANAVADAYASVGFSALYGHTVLVAGPKALPSTVRTYIDQTSASLQGAVLFAPSTSVNTAVLTDAVRLTAGQSAR